MMQQIRGNLGKYFVGGIISIIAAVFIFEGAVSNRSTRGLHEGAVAGTVNGEPISISEYNRALERKMEMMKGILGDKITDEQLKMFRIRETAFQELVQRKLMVQQAEKAGIQPSDEEIRQEIMKLDAFKKDGKFDPMLYKQLLQANNLQSAAFEKNIRDQLSTDAWSKNLMAQVKVSRAEVKEEFMLTQEQRSIKLVSIMAEVPKAGDLSPKEAADKVATMLKKDKSSDAAVNAILKPYNVQVREIPNLNKGAGYVPGLGDDADIWTAIFADASLMKAAKVFHSGTRINVILVTDAKKADPAKFDKEEQKLSAQVREKKSREIMNNLMKSLMDTAKIDPNPSVIGAEQSEG